MYRIYGPRSDHSICAIIRDRHPSYIFSTKIGHWGIKFLGRDACGKDVDYNIIYFAHGTFNTCNDTLKSQTKPYLLPANYLDLRSHLCPLKLHRDH